MVIGSTSEGVQAELREAVRQRIFRYSLDGRAGIFGGNARYVVRKVAHSYVELQRWRLALHRDLARDHVPHSMAFSPRDNKLWIGVSDVGQISFGFASVARSGVPTTAVNLVLERWKRDDLSDGRTTAPAAASSSSAGDSLGTRNRPIHGGMSIESIKIRHISPSPWRIACSVGLGVSYGGQQGWLTAAHCTNGVGTTQTPASSFSQPSALAIPDLVGLEVLDPPFSSCSSGVGSSFYVGDYDGWDGYPPPYGPPPPTNIPITNVAVQYCRNSDLALVGIASGVLNAFSQGTIAHTTFVSVNQNLGSLAVDQSDPIFYVTGETPIVQGLVVDKVGGATGWTRGTVFLSGQNHTVQTSPWPASATQIDTTWTVRGAVVATYRRHDGDSGGPVFQYLGSNLVNLVGFHSGGVSYGAEVHGVFSPMSQVRVDFPLLTTTAVSTPPPPPPPPPLPLSVLLEGHNYVRPSVNCTWFASASGGSGSYTYAWKKNGQPLGTNSSQLSYTNAGSNFTLSVTVSEGNLTPATATMSVSVNSSAPGCTTV